MTKQDDQYKWTLKGVLWLTYLFGLSYGIVTSVGQTFVGATAPLWDLHGKRRMTYEPIEKKCH